MISLRRVAGSAPSRGVGKNPARGRWNLSKSGAGRTPTAPEGGRAPKDQTLPRRRPKTPKAFSRWPDHCGNSGGVRDITPYRAGVPLSKLPTVKIKKPEFRILTIAAAVAFSMLPVQSAPPDPGQSKEKATAVAIARIRNSGFLIFTVGILKNCRQRGMG